MKNYYAYESCPTMHFSSKVNMKNDTSTNIFRTNDDGSTAKFIGPAGRLRVFPSKKSRDRWVADGPTHIRNRTGSEYRIRSSCTAKQAKDSGLQVYVPMGNI